MKQMKFKPGDKVATIHGAGEIVKWGKFVKDDASVICRCGQRIYSVKFDNGHDECHENSMDLIKNNEDSEQQYEQDDQEGINDIWWEGNLLCIKYNNGYIENISAPKEESLIGAMLEHGLFGSSILNIMPEKIVK